MLYKSISLLSTLALIRLADSSPTPQQSNSSYPDYVHPSNGICTDYTVKDTLTYPALHWAAKRFTNNHDVVAVLGDLSSKDGLDTPPFDGTVNVTKTFETAGTFCKPKVEKDGKQTRVLVATHGLGFDRRYWASSYKSEKYSFAQYALDAGYSVFYYDRLGLGHSSRISGFENQATAQVEILARIAEAIHNNKYTDDIKATNVSLVGHSYGSFLSNAVLAKYPKLADSAVLTGIAYPNANDTAAHTALWGPTIFANRIGKTLPEESRPQFADTQDTGYLGFGDMFAYIQAFLHQPDYEAEAAEYSFRVSQALAISEFLGGLAPTTATGWKGRVFVTSGQFDVLLCNGECISTYEGGLQNDVFPDAKVSTWVQPKAGHGQNFAREAGMLYGNIVDFLGGKDFS